MKKLLIVFLILLSISGCNRMPKNKNTKADRIISLAPAATEIICALGKEKDIVAVTNDCNYPLSVKNKPKIGPFGYPILEKIIKYNPNIVITTDFSKHPIIRQLDRLGIKAVNLENSNVEELLKNIEVIGKMLQTKKTADKLIKLIKKDINKYKNNKKNNKPKVFIEIWGNPLFTAGKNSYLGELVDIAGGINITGYIQDNYPQIREEIVIKNNPKIIILAYKGRDNVLKRTKWQYIDAIKYKNVYDNIGYDILQRPGPRVTTALSKLSDIINKNK